MRSHARVVVIGGGNMGAAVLYHLAHEGWTDCLLIEKAELTSGATWHAAGLVSRMIGDHALGYCHDYAVELYKRIEAETGQAVSWHDCGSLRVAASEGHRDWLMHTRDVVCGRGQECHWLEPAEVKRLNPLYDTSAIIGALYTPDDGHVDPSGTCQAMAKGARRLGAQVIRRNRVLDVRPRPSGEWEVVSEAGSVVAEHVVNAGGYHARQIGAFVGLALPIVPLQHHYVVTDAVPEFADMDHEIPVTRDDYFTGYVRREQAGALIGLYDTPTRWRGGPTVAPGSRRTNSSSRISTASRRGSSAASRGIPASRTEALSGSSTAPSLTRPMARPWLGRHRASATTGSPAAPRLASPGGRAWENISRSGWSTARPRSQCAASTPAVSEPGRTAPTPTPVRARTT